MTLDKEIVDRLVKEQHEQREKVIEMSRMAKEYKVNKVKIYEVLRNTLNDAAFNYGLVDGKINSLDLEKYHRDNLEKKDENGFIAITSYDGRVYLRAMKTLLNALKSKNLLVRLYSNEFKNIKWKTEVCENFGGIKFSSGVIHVKKKVSETMHTDYLIKFGKDSNEQKYISYRITRRIPNNKVYEAVGKEKEGKGEKEKGNA